MVVVKFPQLELVPPSALLLNIYGAGPLVSQDSGALH